MMHEGLWDRLIALEPQGCQRRTGCKYIRDSNSYVVTLLHRDYIVNLDEKKIFPADAGLESMEAAFLPQLCILAYLINARSLGLSGKLVGAAKLPGGEFFFRGPHTLPTQKLERTFGRRPELLYEASAHLNPTQRDFGDASVEILVLPCLSLTFTIWADDKEFAARASILFDQTAAELLPLDALGAAVNLTVKSILEARVG